MRKNRMYAVLAACIVSALLFTACAKKTETKDNKVVNLWATGSDNVRQIFEALAADFNTASEYAGKYEVKLNFMLTGTGTQTLVDMVSAAYKAKQTNTDYDIVDLGGDDLSRVVSLIGEEAFVKLDPAKIPNAAGVSAQPPVAKGYLQPYRGTTVVLAYNSKKVSTPPKTTDELTKWIMNNPGRFVYNTPGTGGSGDSFVRTAVYNFIDDASAVMSDDEKWMKEWDPGFAYLAKIHPFMYKSGGSVVYPNKNQGTLDLLSNGEIDMCPTWADMLLSQRAAGTVPEYIKMTTIQPSFTGSVQGLIVPSFGSNKDGAFAFINYILSEQAQTMLVHKMAAIPLVDTTKMDLTGYEDLRDLDVSKFRVMSIGNLSTSFNERWDTEISTLP